MKKKTKNNKRWRERVKSRKKSGGISSFIVIWWRKKTQSRREERKTKSFMFSHEDDMRTSGTLHGYLTSSDGSSFREDREFQWTWKERFERMKQKHRWLGENLMIQWLTNQLWCWVSGIVLWVKLEWSSMIAMVLSWRSMMTSIETWMLIWWLKSLINSECNATLLDYWNDIDVDCCGHVTKPFLVAH